MPKNSKSLRIYFSGLFPDVGGGYFLSRLQGKLGLYLALTGEIDCFVDIYYAMCLKKMKF